MKGNCYNLKSLKSNYLATRNSNQLERQREIKKFGTLQWRMNLGFSSRAVEEQQFFMEILLTNSIFSLQH